jgi:hypothetical protein
MASASSSASGKVVVVAVGTNASDAKIYFNDDNDA